MAYLTNEQLTGEWVERPFRGIDRIVLGDAEYGAKFWRFLAGQEWHLWVRPDGLVTIDQAARLLEVSAQLVDRWWGRGDVRRHARVGQNRMLALSEVREVYHERLREQELARHAR